MGDLVEWKQAVVDAQPRFNAIAIGEDALSYQSEALFSMQVVSKNDKLLEAAMANPNSLKNAVINIASIGLSLNPATKMAYLIPRDNAVCLDISYMGLIKLATDTGSIRWAKAEIVHQNDKFSYRGVNREPSHESDVFGDRGKPIGVYCVAKTSDGDILTEIMTEIDINKVKESSKGATSKYSPWVNFPGEMWKKSVIKRASKTWPKSSRDIRLETAIEVINEHEGLREEYLEHQPDVDGSPVDHMEIEALAQTIREIIDEDIEEEVKAERLCEIADKLNNNESMAIIGKLKISSPVDCKRTYASIYSRTVSPDSNERLAQQPDTGDSSYVI